MLNITDEDIHEYASNEITYSQGQAFYKANKVKSVSWSCAKSQYRIIISEDKGYIVRISVNSKGDVDSFECTCLENNTKSACKHIVAGMLSLTNYYNHQKKIESLDEKEQIQLKVIDYFEKQDFKRIGEEFKLEIYIHINQMLKSDLNSAKVLISAGSTKIYKIQNIKKFISDYINGNNIYIGKDFNFIIGESYFSHKYTPVLDYLIGIYEIQNMSNNISAFYKQQIILTKNMLINFLKLMKDIKFTVQIYGNVYTDVTFVMNDPNIKYSIENKEDSIKLYNSESSGIIPLTDGGELMFKQNKIYGTSEEFIKNYLPLYNYLEQNKKTLEFTGENKKRFLESVLPRIKDTVDIDIPEEISSKYISFDLKGKVFLDKAKKNIKALVKFVYDTVEINPLTTNNNSDSDVIIIRKTKQEEDLLNEVAKLGFVPEKDYFIMKDEKKIYDFINEGIENFFGKYEVFYSEAFKSIRIRQSAKINTTLKINSEINFLEMEIDYDGLDKEDLKDLFNSFRLKKKYYRAKDGTFININNGNIGEFTSVMDSLDLSGKDLKDNSFSLPLNQAFYLNNAFKDCEEINVNKNVNFEQFIERVLNPELSDIEVPNGIKAVLREYQVIGYKWLKTLSLNNMGGILADDMGLGKTLQAIIYMQSYKKENEHFLVVCPSSLVYNWQEEIRNFAPTLLSVVVAGSPEERLVLLSEISDIDVLITSYPLIRKDIDNYEKIKFHTCFIDEAQYIKNPNSLSSRAVKAISAKQKFALTGTPIENSLTELWSIFDFIMPGYLQSHSRFSKKYESLIKREDARLAVENLSKRIRPFILRRMKKDVLKELPDKIITKIVTELTDNQKKVYMSYLVNFKQEINEDINAIGFERSKIRILAALTRLRQICCHPGTFLDNYKGDSGKLILLMQIISDALENDHRILIFSQFTSMLRIIESELKKIETEYFCLEGSTPIALRGEYVARFNNGERSVFLISLKAGGTGLNLTGADTVIHYDPWWNPAIEDQATDRAYRIGQKNSVQVIKLITKGTIEEKIYRLQSRKKDLADSVIETGEVFLNKLSKEELESIFHDE